MVLEASPRATIEVTDPGNIRPGFWIALDQVQDPQVLYTLVWLYVVIHFYMFIESWFHLENSSLFRC